MYRIAASILSADFARLGEEVRGVLAAGADWIHCAALDLHLMVQPVDAPGTPASRVA